MGYYDSGLSGWQRRQIGLPNDHCGDGVIENEESPPVAEEPEVVQPEVVQPKKPPKKTSGL